MDMEMDTTMDPDVENEEVEEDDDPGNSKPADGCIIDAIIMHLKRYIYFNDDSIYLLVALWIAATHLHQEFEFIGFLFFHSAEPESGKSRALYVMSDLVFNSTGVIISVTEAILFRTASGHTQLLDEVDSLKNKETLRSVLNAGFQRNGKVLRAEKTKDGPYKVIEYPAYGPRALSGIGIGILDKTTRDRTFMIEMVRQKIEERREEFRTIEPELASEITALHGVIVVWVEHMKNRVSELYRQRNFPYLKDFRDRTNDLSESLAAVLEAAYEGRPGIVQARKDFLKAIALTRDEKMEQSARDMQIIRVLSSIAQKENPLIGMASESAARCCKEGETVSETEISHTLIKHNFKRKSKRIGGEPRWRYIIDKERLSDILARHPGALEKPSESNVNPATTP